MRAAHYGLPLMLAIIGGDSVRFRPFVDLYHRALDEFDRLAGPAGALYVGSPQTVAGKIAATARALDLTRFDLKYSNGTLPHAAKVRSIELLGAEVRPIVDELLADQLVGA